MAIDLYNHESCISSTKVSSAYCVEMSQALTVDYKQYLIPTTVMLTSNLLSVYLAVKNNDEFTLIKVNSADWTLQTGNKVTINNQLPENLSLHNRVLFIPKNAANLCFTGIDGSTIDSKRALWLKRSDNTKAYDYIALTSINYFADIFTILEFSNINFIDGVSTNYYNLTSEHLGMVVDFDGQRIGTVNNILGSNSLSIDTNYSSIGPSRSFLYNQGSLEFASDNNGIPGQWSRHLNMPIIDNDVPAKFWVRDFKLVTTELTVTANNAIRILGTEFLL